MNSEYPSCMLNYEKLSLKFFIWVWRWSFQNARSIHLFVFPILKLFFGTLFILSWSIRFLMENWIKHGPFCLKWYFHMSFYPLKIGIMNLRLSLPKCFVFSIHKGWNPHLALWLRWKFLRSTFRVCQSIHYTYLFDRKSFKHEKIALISIIVLICEGWERDPQDASCYILFPL